MPDPTESFATPRVAAGALFFDDRGRVLLVHPTYKDTWDLPGGYVEHGESPAAACKRELMEELGIDRRPIRMLSVDWAPHNTEGDKLLFLFDCGRIENAEENLRLAAEELNEWQWVAPADLDRFVIDRLARRIRATITAGIDGSYLEHGVPTLTAT